MQDQPQIEVHIAEGMIDFASFFSLRGLKLFVQFIAYLYVFLKFLLVEIKIKQRCAIIVLISLG